MCAMFSQKGNPVQKASVPHAASPLTQAEKAASDAFFAKKIKDFKDCRHDNYRRLLGLVDEVGRFVTELIQTPAAYESRNLKNLAEELKIPLDVLEEWQCFTTSRSREEIQEILKMSLTNDSFKKSLPLTKKYFLD